MFDQKLQVSLDGALESKLEQDAFELAFKLIAFQQATSHILANAQQQVSATETSIAKAPYHIKNRSGVLPKEQYYSSLNSKRIHLIKSFQ